MIRKQKRIAALRVAVVAFGLTLILASSSLTLVAAQPQSTTTGTTDATTVAGNGTEEIQTTPSVTFENQTTNGSGVIVSSADLPADGFLVLHGQPFVDAGQQYVIGASDRLEAGTHQNITISASSSPPGSQNISRINETERYAVKFYPDTDGNGEFTYYDLPPTRVDAPDYPGNGYDVATVTSRADPRYNESYQWPSVAVSDQTTKSESIIVDSVTLPRGGYAVVHDSSFLPPKNNTYESVIGVSEKLSPGTHRNVTIDLSGGVPGSVRAQFELQSEQQIAVSAARDTGENGSFEYVTSEGGDDTIYLDQNSTFASDTATLEVIGQSDTSSSDSNAYETTTALSTESSTEEDQGGLIGFFISHILIISIVVALLCIVLVGMIISRQRKQQNQSGGNQ